MTVAATIFWDPAKRAVSVGNETLGKLSEETFDKIDRGNSTTKVFKFVDHNNEVQFERTYKITKLADGSLDFDRIDGLLRKFFNCLNVFGWRNSLSSTLNAYFNDTNEF